MANKISENMMLGKGNILPFKSLYESIIDSCDDAIISKDIHGVITSWNKGAEDLFGYTAEEVIGKNITIIIPPNYKDEEVGILNKIKRGEKVKHYETKRVRKDGTFVEISITISPIKDENGTIIGASKIARDITELKLVEDKIQKSEYDYKRLVDNIIDGLMIDDLSGKIIFANEQFRQLFGLAEADMENLVLEDYVAPEYHELLRDRHNKRIAGEDVPTEFEYVGVRKDGERRWMGVRVSKVIENGITVGTQTAIRDITDYKLAEDQLLQSLKEIKDYKYALDESSIVAITDQKGIIKYVNENFCKISKYPKEELIGQDHRIINSGYHTKAFIRNLWVTIANGNIWRGEIKNKAKDGTFYWVDTTIVPFKNEAGKPFRYIAIRYDITERKATEEKLLYSENIYRNIVTNLPGAIISIIDREGKFIIAEGEGIALLGLTKGDFIHKSKVPNLSAATYRQIEELRNRAFNGEEFTTELKTAHRYFRVRYVPIKNENDYVASIMTISLDITDIKKAETDIKELNESLEKKVNERTLQLELANKELEAFSYSVSHDLRAPLRIINGYADILISDYGKKLEDEGSKMLGRIMNNTQRMGTLIDELLKLAQLGRKELVLQKNSMNNIVSHVLEEQIALAKKPINIQKIDLPPVVCDSGLIRQVWSNLISNAIKYSGKNENQMIEINCIENENEYVFSVTDNGVGFDMEYKDKLFGVFQRLHKRNEFEGTGVGLALVKRILLRHGGLVWANAEVDKGATFYFSLPK